MVVCVCHNVNQDFIKECIGNGFTITDLEDKKIACTKCKKCYNYINNIIENCKRGHNEIS